MSGPGPSLTAPLGVLFRAVVCMCLCLCLQHTPRILRAPQFKEYLQSIKVGQRRTARSPCAGPRGRPARRHDRLWWAVLRCTASASLSDCSHVAVSVRVLCAGVRPAVLVPSRRWLSAGDGCGRGCGCGRGPSARLQVQDAAQFVAAQVRVLRHINVRSTHIPHFCLRSSNHCFFSSPFIVRRARLPPPHRFLQQHIHFALFFNPSSQYH